MGVNTNNMGKRKGPKVELSCEGCTHLHTSIGFQNLHHKCKKDAWDGYTVTPAHFFPQPTKKCPYTIISL